MSSFLIERVKKCVRVRDLGGNHVMVTYAAQKAAASLYTVNKMCVNERIPT